MIMVSDSLQYLCAFHVDLWKFKHKIYEMKHNKSHSSYWNARQYNMTMINLVVNSLRSSDAYMRQ